MLKLDLSGVSSGGLPAGWKVSAPRPSLEPVFKVVRQKNGQRELLAAGNGRDDCAGYISRPVKLNTGRTYSLQVRFRMSAGINPNRNLLFVIWSERPGGQWFLHNGIFEFRKVSQNQVEGEGKFEVPSEGVTWQTKGKIAAEVRIIFKWSRQGKVWIEALVLKETEPVAPRLVTVACVSGRSKNGLAEWSAILEAAGKEHADIILLPEHFSGKKEELDGPSAELMRQKSVKYNMYVAGGITWYDRAKDRLYNTSQLFDRRGNRVGIYRKIHPFTAESFQKGIFPGKSAPVFKTDFGTVGMMICYDSWFNDVAELLALKGAELILFSSAGYYRSIMPARAADNGLRIVASSSGTPGGIWDVSGREVTEKEDPTCMCRSEPWLAARPSFKNVRVKTVAGKRLLIASLDLSIKLSPHNWGGPILSAPGGRRNRREQLRLLYSQINKEAERWWQ